MGNIVPLSRNTHNPDVFNYQGVLPGTPVHHVTTSSFASTPLGFSNSPPVRIDIQRPSIRPPDLTILHFNDAHNIIPPKEKAVPIGGATRFATVVHQRRKEYECLLLFSGDCYNPSRLSTITKGKHVSPVLKALNVDCAVYGNHDFDFGPDELVKLAKASGIPWVMSNVVDSRTNEPVAGSKQYHILTHNFVIVGIIGIVEEEWLATIRDLPSWVQYRDKVECAKSCISKLKSQGAQIIIALTHQREYNDIKFLEDTPEVDLLLGGHDHYYRTGQVGGVTWVKSSADFVHTSFLKIWLPDTRSGQNKPRVEIEKIPIMSSIEEDPEISSIVESYNKGLSEQLSKDVCVLESELDVCTEFVRQNEAAVGNFVTDVMKTEYQCDCAILNSGVFRANLTYLPCTLKMKDLMDILPMEDIVVSMKIKGKFIRAALESGISKYPALEGRFPQVSGIKMTIDPNKPPNNRIVDLRINNSKVKNEEYYKLATTEYLAKGGDGYTSLKQMSEEDWIIDTENGIILPTMVRQYINNLIPPDKTTQRRESKRLILSDNSLTPMVRQTSISELRKNYLPSIRPQVESRIIFQSDGMLRKDSTSSISSATSSLAVPRVLSRRTSFANPIPITDTISLITGIPPRFPSDDAISHSHSDRPASRASSDGGSPMVSRSPTPSLSSFQFGGRHPNESKNQTRKLFENNKKTISTPILDGEMSPMEALFHNPSRKNQAALFQVKEFAEREYAKSLKDDDHKTAETFRNILELLDDGYPNEIQIPGTSDHPQDAMEGSASSRIVRPNH